MGCKPGLFKALEQWASTLRGWHAPFAEPWRLRLSGSGILAPTFAAYSCGVATVLSKIWFAHNFTFTLRTFVDLQSFVVFQKYPVSIAKHNVPMFAQRMLAAALYSMVATGCKPHLSLMMASELSSMKSLGMGSRGGQTAATCSNQETNDHQ